MPDLDWWDRLTSRRPFSVASAFVAGEFDVAGDLVAAMRWWSAGHWWSARHQPIGRHWLFGLLAALRPESWFQTSRQARRNVRFHYDRSNAFYQLFLDRKMLYSCAYFADPCWTLDEAQDAKLDLICRKLDLQPDETFLDVGCGWGGLVIHAAERFGVSAVGCTLSTGQLAFAQQAARERNVAHRVVVEERD